jgi:hypothetical protein
MTVHGCEAAVAIERRSCPYPRPHPACSAPVRFLYDRSDLATRGGQPRQFWDAPPSTITSLGRERAE